MASPQINAVNMSFLVLIGFSDYDLTPQRDERVEGHLCLMEQLPTKSGCPYI